MGIVPAKIQISSQRLDAWIEGASFRGWDPFDALNSPLLKKLTGTNRRIGQLWVQLFKRSPINFRPFLGISKAYNPKAMGLFLGTYMRKYQCSRSNGDLMKAQFFAKWLAENQSKDWSGACWGYNFDWPNRAFFAPARTPTVVNTAFIGMALLDHYRLTGNQNSLEIARSACEFIQRDLNRYEGAEGEICLSYTPLDHRFVHNANILSAWLLAEVFALTGENKLAEMALSCVRFSVRQQAANGSWSYGVASNDQWIDNFHTGYVLVGLKRIAGLLDRPEFHPAVEKGYQYWQKSFFLEDGVPKFYPDQVFPVDVHVISQGILTYLEFLTLDTEARGKAIRLAQWGIDHFQDPDGFFYYQQNRLYTIRIPFMRWSQAWMQRALSELLVVV